MEMAVLPRSVRMHLEGACSSGEFLCKGRKVSRGISREGKLAAKYIFGPLFLFLAIHT